MTEVTTEYAWQNDCGEIRLTVDADTALALAERFNGTPLERSVTKRVSYGDWIDPTKCTYRFPLPGWAGEDQIDRCECIRDKGHDGDHRCAHESKPE